jgi:hypothetical protein
MAADCYLCSIGAGALPGGELGAALGVCQFCGCFACAGHGQRQKSHPRWICAQCDTAILTACGSGALASSLGDEPGETRDELGDEDVPAAPRRRAIRRFSHRLNQEARDYPRLEAFIDDRQRYDWLLRAAVREMTRGALSPRLKAWMEGDRSREMREAVEFLAAAIALAQRLELAAEERHEMLNRVMETAGRR